jgi:hypothetical protein
MKDKRGCKFECECGGKYNGQNKAEHKRSVKHLKYERMLAERKFDITRADALVGGGTADALVIV